MFLQIDLHKLGFENKYTHQKMYAIMNQSCPQASQNDC